MAETDHGQGRCPVTAIPPNRQSSKYRRRQRARKYIISGHTGHTP